MAHKSANGGIDFHCHSTASDGTLSPTAVVNAAHAASVHVLALTDHDTTAGLAEARQAATRHAMQFVNGVEISTRWRSRSIHIVGLDIDPACTELQTGLTGLQRQRDERARRIADKLTRQGVNNAWQRVSEMAGGGQITRAHFARLLVEEGRCRDLRRAFKQWLGPGKPAHVNAHWVDIASAVAWILEAGGQAVLAHPLVYRLSRTQLDRLIEIFRQAGGVGMEICCGNTDHSSVTRVARIASEYGLAGSVGSDFHDPAQHWQQLGGTARLPHSLTAVQERFQTTTAVR